VKRSRHVRHFAEHNEVRHEIEELDAFVRDAVSLMDGRTGGKGKKKEGKETNTIRLTISLVDQIENKRQQR
jgi:hypothetical protein